MINKHSLSVPVAAIALLLLPALCCASVHHAVIAQPSAALGQGQVPAFTSAAIAREWGDAALQAGRYEAASQAYFQEADLREKLGDTQGAEVERRRAWADGTDLKIVCPVTIYPGGETAPLAKLEPPSGCLIGALDTPTEGRTFPGESVADDFEQRIGKPVAVAFRYLRYGQDFPFAWAHQQALKGRAIEIAMEPYDIFAVSDDDYLEGFAADMQQSGAKVFLRFGGEMNGSWAPWGKDPEQYRKAFRTVHDVIAEFCPSCAMVWAPDMAPLDNIDQYYPGDDVVDWVGLSLYLVKYADDDKTQPLWQNSPAAYIDPFYRKYAQHKPMALVECAVTREAHADGAPDDQFAAARIEDLLEAIKVRYPQIKMMCWFDRNNLNGLDVDRRLNDFSLPPYSGALAAFKTCVADPYFLSRMPDEIDQLPGYEPLAAGLASGYSGPAAISLDTYSLDPTVTVSRDGDSTIFNRPFNVVIPDGPGPVTFTVRDEQGRIAKTYTYGAQPDAAVASAR